MMKLDNFVGMMTGHFDNKDQFNKMQAEGKTYPYAEHVNTICNVKISKENLLLKRVIMKLMENVMHLHIFSLSRK